jgi:LEA14-like dessication related protein
MNKNWLLVAAGAIAIWFVGKKKIAGDQIKWQFTGLDINKLALNIQLINPTNTPLNFSAFVAEIFINGSSLGILDYRSATTLSANGMKNISIPIKLNPLAAITLLGFIRNPQALKKATITLDGTINAENISIPFKQNINLA